MDTGNVKVFKRGGNIPWKRRKKQARSAVMHGPRGTWVAGQGRKYSKHRNGWWIPAGVDDFSGGQAIQYMNIRGRIGCKNNGADQSKGGGLGGWQLHGG